ncbi:MAG TPA: alpha/beta hydrolase, partial [Polyangiaceae bacterium]|nr:alpha/beta hydrolase [Polyangiaceae bacterium]
VCLVNGCATVGRMGRSAIAVGLAMVAASACHPASSKPVAPVTTDGLVQVGSLSMYVHCVGEGGPLVVLEAGLGNDASVWDRVEPRIGRFTHVCAYDRAGLGRSSLAPRPHSNRQMAQELYSLLHEVGFAPPYVLVGHSMGGTNVRLFAGEHPNEVVGMVLVDAASGEDWLQSFALHSESSRAEFKQGLLKLPEGLDFDTFKAGFADADASGGSLGDTPLLVLTRGREPNPPPPGVSAEVAAKVGRVHRERQPDLLRLSSNSLQIVAANGGHLIQVDVPDLVVAAVAEVVDASRNHRRLHGTTLSAIASRPAP